jgi:curli biogenesis system outer membrane secretion channel CsgG
VSLPKHHIGLGLLILLFTFYFGCTPGPKPVMERQTSTVAVWDLENLNPNAAIGADMGELLAAEVIETFKESSTFQVVERQRLILALEELNLGSSALANEATRLRIGRIVGARFMVFGGYFVLGDMMRLDLRLVEVETGTIVKAAEKTTAAGDLNGWLKATRQAAEELI